MTPTCVVDKNAEGGAIGRASNRERRNKHPDVEDVANRFLKKMERPVSDDVCRLIEAAFTLYHQEWDCHRHKLANWNWPFEQIDNEISSKQFQGNEPWSVLFRAALELHKTQLTP